MKVTFETKGGSGALEKWLNNASNHDPSVALNKIASEGERSLSANTPRETGETAEGWVAEITTKNGVSEIDWKNTAHPESNVNVAKLIELGHGTRNGGYVSPQPYIKQAMEKVWKNTDKLVEELIK